MKRKEAIRIVINNIGKENAVISSTGLISRELFKMKDSPQNFYMTGSMGLASSLGLGLATNTKKKVIVIEGDCSLLMNLGSLATIGHHSPTNLTHIILDNAAFGSCSEEPSVSRTAKLGRIAKTVGYKNVYEVSTKKELSNSIRKSSSKKGPTLILVLIKLGGKRDLPRPLDLVFIAKRFRAFITKSQKI